MTTRKKKKPRTFTHAHRQRLDRAAAHYLDACYREQKAASGKGFAEFLGLTPEYVSWLAVKILGKSLHEFFREKQVAAATGMLRTTSYPIDEIATRCGFGSSRTLYRRFRETHGVTPKEYRELKK